MEDVLVKMVFCVFGLLSVQLFIALLFGRINYREYRFARPVWLFSALLLSAATFELIESGWVYVLAGVMAAMAVIHLGVEHIVAIQK